MTPQQGVCGARLRVYVSAPNPCLCVDLRAWTRMCRMLGPTRTSLCLHRTCFPVPLQGSLTSGHIISKHRLCHVEPRPTVLGPTTGPVKAWGALL